MEVIEIDIPEQKIINDVGVFPLVWHPKGLVSSNEQVCN